MGDLLMDPTLGQEVASGSDGSQTDVED